MKISRDSYLRSVHDVKIWNEKQQQQCYSYQIIPDSLHTLEILGEKEWLKFTQSHKDSKTNSLFIENLALWCK